MKYVKYIKRSSSSSYSLLLSKCRKAWSEVGLSDARIGKLKYFFLSRSIVLKQSRTSFASSLKKIKPSISLRGDIILTGPLGRIDFFFLFYFKKRYRRTKFGSMNSWFYTGLNKRQWPFIFLYYYYFLHMECFHFSSLEYIFQNLNPINLAGLKYSEIYS